MPTYTNAATTDEYVDGQRIARNGGQISSAKYATTISDPVNVTKTSDLPYYNPVLISATYTVAAAATETITVPSTRTDGTTVQGYHITISCISGKANIFWNTTANTPGMLHVANCVEDIRFSGRFVDKIVIVGVDPSSVFLVRVDAQ